MIEYFEADFDNHNQLTAFVHIYQSAYNEPPYSEIYSSKHVEKIWEMYRNHCVIMAKYEEQLVGLGCALTTELNPALQQFFLKQKKLPFDLNATIMMSDLAVLKSYRNKGIGSGLIQQRLEWAKNRDFRYFLMQTAKKNSNSNKLYLRIGAKEIPGLVYVDDSWHHCTEHIFLWGKIS